MKGAIVAQKNLYKYLEKIHNFLLADDNLVKVYIICGPRGLRTEWRPQRNHSWQRIVPASRDEEGSPVQMIPSGGSLFRTPIRLFGLFLSAMQPGRGTSLGDLAMPLLAEAMRGRQELVL
jgi:hypothetical protein